MCLFIIVVMWAPVYVFTYYYRDVDTSLCVYLLGYQFKCLFIAMDIFCILSESLRPVPHYYSSH